jgi:hypothetical protein
MLCTNLEIPESSCLVSASCDAKDFRKRNDLEEPQMLTPLLRKGWVKGVLVDNLRVVVVNKPVITSNNAEEVVAFLPHPFENNTKVSAGKEMWCVDWRRSATAAHGILPR